MEELSEILSKSRDDLTALLPDFPSQAEIAPGRKRRRLLPEEKRRAKIERDRERRSKHKSLLIKAQIWKYKNKKLKDENIRLNERVFVLDEIINSLHIALHNICNKYNLSMRNLPMDGVPLQSMVARLIRTPAGEHLPLTPDLCISAPVPTQVMAAMTPQKSVIDKETVINEFTMRAPFLFVASKTEEVTGIGLRGKCTASPEGCLLQYLFEWIPSNNMDLIQNSAPAPSCRVGVDDGGSSDHQGYSPVRYLLWNNSVGAFNAESQRIVRDLINHFQPAVLVLAETMLSLARAEEIMDTFPFYRIYTHRVTANLGYVGRIWLLWRSGVVEVQVLSCTDQEIHALIKNTPSIEQVPNNEPAITEPQGSDEQQFGQMRYYDELVEKFTKKLDAMEENKVRISDFKGLKEEMEEIGPNNVTYLPPSLAPIDERIKREHGDITLGIPASAFIVRDCYILLCAVIKEMDELELEQVDEEKMLFWRDAINNGLFIKMRVEFAMNHLKNIARAYYGLKACNDEKDMEFIERRISELKIELVSLEEKRVEKTEEYLNSEVRKQCIDEAEKFRGKPLSTYLFRSEEVSLV